MDSVIEVDLETAEAVGEHHEVVVHPGEVLEVDVVPREAARWAHEVARRPLL